MNHSIVTLLSLGLLALAGCTDTQQADLAPRPKPVTGKQVVELGGLPDRNEPGPNNHKELLGLDLQPIGGWKPVWDARAETARWEHHEYMSPVVVRLVTEKLDDIEDLKQAAPWMMQLGSAITDVIQVQSTTLGWYAIVERGKEKDLVYVQKHGSATVVCSARLTRSEIKTIKVDVALQLCETIRIRAQSGPAQSTVPQGHGTH